MAPYDPPHDVHYSQFDVSGYDEQDVWRFCGQQGGRFYWLTRRLNLKYIWYDKNRKVIELWGPYWALQNFQAHHIIECELNLSVEKNKSNDNYKDEDDASEGNISLQPHPPSPSRSEVEAC